MIKKNSICGVMLIALGMGSCLADYVARDFISPRTGQSSIFWGDAAKGKDAYVLEYDKESDHYYFKKVEKNKPAVKAKKEVTPKAQATPAA